MPRLGIVHDGQPMKWEDIPHTVLPGEMVNALQFDDRATDGFHLSKCTICVYRIVREELQDFYIPKDQTVKLLRGKGWDYLADKHKTTGNVLYQGSFYRDVKGVRMTGHPDVVDYDRGFIADYKAPSRKKKGPDEGNNIQLNGYKLFVNDERILNLYLNVVGPTDPVVMPVEVWSDQKTEDTIAERLDDYFFLKETKYIGTCGRSDCYICKQAAHWVE